MGDADTPLTAASAFAPFLPFGFADFLAPEAVFLVFSVIWQSVSQTEYPLNFNHVHQTLGFRKPKLSAGFANRP